MHWSIFTLSKLVFPIPVATVVAHTLQWIITSPSGNTISGASVYLTNMWLRVIKWMWNKRKRGRIANRTIKAPLTLYMGQQGNCGWRWNSPTTEKLKTLLYWLLLSLGTADIDRYWSTQYRFFELELHILSCFAFSPLLLKKIIESFRRRPWQLVYSKLFSTSGENCSSEIVSTCDLRFF